MSGKETDLEKWDCPLCGQKETYLFHKDKRRPYYRCSECVLVFVPLPWHLSAEEEKAEYDLHENDPYDEGYRRFLSRVMAPLVERIPRDAKGLDFGCGPGPALALMFQEAGYETNTYDPFYAPDAKVLKETYQFVTATEVVEHFHRPGEAFGSLWALVEPGGWLGIMTKMVRDVNAFAGWHYKNDLTHVAFYSVPTFQWLANEYEAEVFFEGSDVVLMQKRT